MHHKLQVLLVEVVVANAPRSSSKQVIPRLENPLELLRVPSLISLSPTASPTAQDRDHEKKLEEKRQEFEERKIHIETTSECRTRCFNRRAQLTDLARQYRRSIAEINPRDNNSKRLREFYESEGRIVQQEIKEVDKEIDMTYSSRRM